jgi:predicted DNA binding CopG/RHH family protein
MSRTLDVIRNKNKREKEAKARRKQDLVNIQVEAAFKAKLYADVKKDLDIILSDENVDKVCIEVPKQHLAKFMKAIYSEEMVQYNITQLDTNKFEVGRKMITF